MITLEVEQGTPEWLQARLGIPTASQFSRIMYKNENPSVDDAKRAFREKYNLARIVGDDKAAFETYFEEWKAANQFVRSKSADKYMRRLAGERVSGSPAEDFKGEYMERGNEVEAEARSFYAMSADYEITEVGICYRDDRKRYSCSPDGLVGDDGGVEIKSPAIETHVESLQLQVVPSQYYQQIQGNLFVTGRKWWDFFSYYPNLKPLKIRVMPDLAFHAALEVMLDNFCNDLDKLVEEIS